MSRKKMAQPTPTTGFAAQIAERMASDLNSLRDQLAKFSEAFADRDAKIEELTDADQKHIGHSRELEEKINELENATAGLPDTERVIDQLESLATDTDRSSAPQTPEQWSRCLREIIAGRDWELGTWR